MTDNVPSPAIEPIGQRMVLEEQRRAFDHLSDSANAVDTKLQALLNSASLIISLVGTVQIVVLRQAGGFFFWAGLAVVIVLYVVMVGFVLWGLRPINYFEPIDSEWENLAIRYFDESEDHVLQYLIRDYLDGININGELNKGKILALRVATILFMAIIIVILLAMPLSLAT
jgi:hypothetical protein